MQWKRILWLVGVVSITSAQLTDLVNTIDNNLGDQNLDDNNENTQTLDSEEVPTSTKDYKELQTEEGNESTVSYHETVTEENISNDILRISSEIDDEDNVDKPYSTDQTELRSSGEHSDTIEPDNPDIEADIIIETTSGAIRGFSWEHNEHIRSYIDIPYGVFKGPFQAPEPPERMLTIHGMKDHTKRCPQLHNDEYVGETDCLTLSIFTLNNVTNASVLFHIHDGKFVSDSADPAIYGPDFLVPQGVILVLPNYRLGPLGFLCMLNETAPGNAALKDLTLALNWTKENIAQFGGNPDNIVVSGDGMSGALAGYLALSPRSNGYVNKVILESGSVLSHWALDRNPYNKAAELIEKLGSEAIDEVDLKTLLTAAKGIEFAPCLDNTTDGFIAETPWAMIHNEKPEITFMIGFATYAGIHEALSQSEESIKILNDDYGELLPNDLTFRSDAERTNVGNNVKTQYFGDSAISLTDIRNLALYFTDAAYLGPGIRSARPLVEAGATVYFYEFSFVGNFNRELEAVSNPVEGAVIRDIIGYVFSVSGKPPDEESSEDLMVKTLVDLWITFIETGEPSSEDIVWNRLDNTSYTEEEWLSINTTVEMKKGVHVDRLKLWTEIYAEHFIERNASWVLSPTVYVVLLGQFLFWVGLFKNISHLY